jgi:hypothetical protein
LLREEYGLYQLYSAAVVGGHFSMSRLFDILSTMLDTIKLLPNLVTNLPKYTVMDEIINNATLDELLTMRKDFKNIWNNQFKDSSLTYDILTIIIVKLDERISALSA